MDFLKPGIGNVGSYMVSSKPFVSGGLVIPRSGSAPLRLDFPSVTKRVTFKNTSVGDIRVGFDLSDMTGSNQYMLVKASKTFTSKIALNKIYLMSDTTTARSGAILAEMSGIANAELAPYEEDPFVSASVPDAVLWTPLDLPTLSVFFDAQTEGAVTVDGSGYVTGWTDDYAGLATTPNGGATSAITYSATGLNGLPAIVMGGTGNAWLSSAGSISCGTLAIVAQYKTGVETTFTTEFPGMISVGTSQAIYVANGSAQSNWFNSAGLTTGTRKGDSQFSIPTSVALPMPPTVHTATGEIITGAIHIGGDRNFANYGWQGAISLVIGTSIQLNTSDRQKLEGWCAWHCGLEGDLPIGHPYKSAPPTTTDNVVNYGGITPTYEWDAAQGFLGLEDGSVTLWSDRVSGATLNTVAGTSRTHSIANGNIDFVGARIGSSAVSLISTGAWHWFAVVDIDAITAAGTNTYDGQKILTDASGGQYYSMQLKTDGVGGYLASHHQYDGGFKHATTPITLGKHIVECKKEAGSLYVSVDGGAFSAAVAAGAASGAGTYIGGATTYGVPFDGKIFTVQTYTAALGTTDRDTQLAYLAAKYSVTLV